jgi:hypothetical protein
VLQPQDTETRGCGDDICTAPWWRSPTFDTALREDLNQIAERGKEAGQRVGRRAAAAILARRVNDGSDAINPRMGVEFHPSDDPGKWRMDPISEIPIALGATWGDVKPLVLRSGRVRRGQTPGWGRDRHIDRAHG